MDFVGIFPTSYTVNEHLVLAFAEAKDNQYGCEDSKEMKKNFDAPVATEIILLYPEVSTRLYISLWYKSRYFLSSPLL